MPYYIKKGCGGKAEYWSVISSGGKEHGCHATKKAAIDQAVAISISTKEPFKGEKRKKVKEPVGSDIFESIDDKITMIQFDVAKLAKQI